MSIDPLYYYDKVMNIIDGRDNCKNINEIFDIYSNLRLNADVIPNYGPYKNPPYITCLTATFLEKINNYELIIKVMENFPDEDDIDLFSINDIEKNIDSFCNRILNSTIKFTEKQIINIDEYLFKKDYFKLLTLFLNKYKEYNILNRLHNLTLITIEQFNFLYEKC